MTPAVQPWVAAGIDTPMVTLFCCACAGPVAKPAASTAPAVIRSTVRITASPPLLSFTLKAALYQHGDDDDRPLHSADEIFRDEVGQHHDVADHLQDDRAD